jgi:hypothetical protein
MQTTFKTLPFDFFDNLACCSVLVGVKHKSRWFSELGLCVSCSFVEAESWKWFMQVMFLCFFLFTGLENFLTGLAKTASLLDQFLKRTGSHLNSFEFQVFCS